MKNTHKYKKIKNTITTSGIVILAMLLFKYSFITKTDFRYDTLASIAAVIIFHTFYKRLNQSFGSYSFFVASLILHNLSFYGTSPLGIRFDHYMHFLSGFTIAFIGNRLLLPEKLSALKRFALVIIFSLGIGAIGEIFEWVGYAILGAGDGFFFYGTGDEGEWNNAIKDLIFNSFGAILFAALSVVDILGKILNKNPNRSHIW